MKSPLLFAAALLLLGWTSTAHCQILTSAVDFKLEYWRSFHGVIKQEVRVDPEGKIWLNTTVEKGMTDEDRKKDSTHTIQQISERDLKSLLALFNSYDARTFFSETKPRQMLDGSSLSITVNQNLFAMTFWAQSPFEKDAQSFTVKLAEEARRLFKLAKLDLEKEPLY